MFDAQTISIEPHAEVVWAVLHKAKLDDAIIEQMQREVPAAAAKRPGQPVILDMSEVQFVPSIALGALVILMRSLKRDGHRLLIVGIQPEIRNVLAITRIDKLLELHGSFEEAVSHLRNVPQ